MVNNFCHIEFMSRNPEKAKAFYGSLFSSWEFSDSGMEGMDYTMLQTGEQPGGGLMKAPHADAPPMWNVYVTVENLDETVAQAEKLGGQLAVPKTEVPGHGSFAYIKDPEGALFGVWEVAAKA